MDEEKHEAIKKEATVTKDQKIEILSQLDMHNQPFNIENVDRSFVRPFNSFDCIQINMQIEKIKSDPYASKVVISPFEMAIIDLLNMRVHYWDTTNIKGFED